MRKASFENSRSRALWMIATLLFFAVLGQVRALPDTPEPATLTQLAAAQRPELALQVGHSARVNAVTFSPDNTTIASGSADGTVKLWDARSGYLKRTLAEYGDDVYTVAFSPDGETLAAAGGTMYPRGIYLWEARSGQRKRILEVPDGGQVQALAFSPQGHVLAGRANDDVLLWDWETGLLLGSLKGHGGYASWLAFSPDGLLLATGGRDKLVKVWDARSGELKRTLTGHGSFIEAGSFSADGKMLATSASIPGAAMAQSEVRLWDTQTGTLQRTLTLTGLNSLSFSRDGSHLIAGHMDNTVKVWDARSGELKRTLASHTNQVLAVAVSPGGGLLASASADATLKVWNAESGDLLNTLSGNQSDVRSVAFSPDAKMIAGAGGSPENVRDTGNDAIRLWDAATGELLRTLRASSQAVNCVAFSPDSQVIASGSAAYRAPDASMLGDVRIWDVHTGRLIRTLNGHGNAVTGVAFSPDGAILASSSDDMTVKMWDAKTGDLLRTLTGHNHLVNALAYSRDGHMLASAGQITTADGSSTESEIRVWDAHTGELRHILKRPGTMLEKCIAFSPDSKTIAAGGRNSGVVLFDVETQTSQLVGGHGGEVEAVEFSPDGSILASAGNDRTIKLWESNGLKLRSKLATPGSNALSSIAFSPDGQKLISGSKNESTIEIWNLQQKELLARLYSLPAQRSKGGFLAANNAPSEDYITVTSQGYYAGSAAADRYVRLRVGDTLYPAESFQSRYYRPDIVRDALSGRGKVAPAFPQRIFPPLVTIVSPAAGSDIKGETITATLLVSAEHEIKRVEVFINGARVKPIDIGSKPIEVGAKAIEVGAKAIDIGAKPIEIGSKTLPPEHKVIQQVKVIVPLPPNVPTIKLQAVAFDENEWQSEREEVLFSHATATTPDKITGKLLGLCVGVSRYKDSKLNLKYADADADALAAALNKQSGVYNLAQVTSVTNEQATSGAVLTALDRLIAQTTHNDTVVVLLSGHGWRSDERNFYFATYEVDRKDVSHSALSWRDVVGRLAQLSEKSKRVIVLLDACHSGSAATNENLVKAVLSANAGVLIFASSKGSEVSLELNSEKHGAFSKALLEGIGGQAAVGEKSVTLWDFVTYVRRRVKQLTEGAQNPQVPFLQDFDTDAAISGKA